MRISQALLFGLVWLAGAADPASARFLSFSVFLDSESSGAASWVTVNSESDLQIARKFVALPRSEPNNERAIEPAKDQDKLRRVAQGKQSPASGEVSRGWLGARVQGVTQDIADGLGMKVPAGVVVAVVVPGSPAEQAGLRRGDVILKIDGADVGTAQVFAQKIGQMAPGKSVSLALLRRGTQQSLTVKLQSHPAAAAPSAQELPAHSDDIGLNPLLGFSVEWLSDEARSGHGIAEHVWGVVVTQVQPTQKLLKVHEVVVEVDQQVVTTPDQLVRRVNAVRRTGRRSVLLTIATPHGDTRYVAVSFSTTAPGAKKDGGGEPLKELPPLEQLEKLR